MGTLLEAARQYAREISDKFVVAFRDESFTFVELQGAALAVADGLARAGVALGDCVCLTCVPKPVKLGCYVGIRVLGAIAVLVDKGADAETYLLRGLAIRSKGIPSL